LVLTWFLFFFFFFFFFFTSSSCNAVPSTGESYVACTKLADTGRMKLDKPWGRKQEGEPFHVHARVKGLKAVSLPSRCISVGEAEALIGLQDVLLD
jgi:hypothetical protein